LGPFSSALQWYWLVFSSSLGSVQKCILFQRFFLLSTIFQSPCMQVSSDLKVEEESPDLRLALAVQKLALLFINFCKRNKFTTWSNALKFFYSLL